jgi:acyl-CoA thioesterase
MDEERKRVYFRKVEQEPYPKLLGIRLVDVREGYARCEMIYRDELDNMNGIAHGGAIFSLIDQAFEISSNSRDNIAVALNINVTYIRPPIKHTLLSAESKEISRSHRTATYSISVSDDEGLIALCQALVYIKNEKIPF